MRAAREARKNSTQKYYDAKVKANRRPRTLSEINSILGRFVEFYPDKGVHEITPANIEKWLDSTESSGLTRKKHIKIVRGFFNYAYRRKLIQYNPTESMDSPSTDEKMPEFLRVSEVKKILRIAENKYPQMTSTPAIAFFSGIRTSELLQLQWNDINFEEMVISVKPEVAKKRRHRYVNISGNLLMWLIKYRQAEGRISPPETTFNRLRREIAKKANVVGQ